MAVPFLAVQLAAAPRVVTARFIKPLLHILLQGLKHTGLHQDNRITHFCCEAVRLAVDAEAKKGEIDVLFEIQISDHILSVMLGLVNESRGKARTKQLENDVAAVLATVVDVYPQNLNTLLNSSDVMRTLVSFLVPLKVGGSCYDKTLDACRALAKLTQWHLDQPTPIRVWHGRILQAIPEGRVGKVLGLLRGYRECASSLQLVESAKLILEEGGVEDHLDKWK